ncbi:hypothetical protein L6164_023874 [Bauhinia variegata]|uniref:Uncharacterized protein n=1 Tax=Bauhinia variegata TaxID=167791 RepID=A0ACB9MK04_BAUVA|nr:hypothetical protein L6164_023874 [Bauhinia variegata]
MWASWEFQKAAMEVKRAVQRSHSGGSGTQVSQIDPQVTRGLQARLTRLLKADVLTGLAELKRQNKFHLSLKVFNFIREEVGYETELSLFCDMILLLGRNKKIEMAQELFSEISR